jgi:hypothetical protein
MSRQHPITVDIHTAEDGYLVVENNLIKKNTKVDSTGIGLLTIREKYKLLQRPDVKIEERQNGKFTVRLPLIEP